MNEDLIVKIGWAVFWTYLTLLVVVALLWLPIW